MYKNFPNSKFRRSQAAHNRLSRVYDNSDVLVCNYHANVWGWQRKFNRLLTPQEKRSVYYDTVTRNRQTK